MQTASAGNTIVTVDGRSVRCRTTGAISESTDRPGLALPLLLLHGLSCSADAWLPFLRCREQAPAGQSVIAPDLPGSGYSPGRSEVLGMEELADWTARLLDALAIPRAHVAGSSMGAQVALALARRHPSRVGGLVLVGPTTGKRFLRIRHYVLGLILDGLREPLAYNRMLVRMYWQMGPRRYFATARKMLEDDPLECPEAVGTPCLVVRGAHDPILPEAVARHLASALPGGAFAQIDRVAHAVQFSAPTRFARLALPFLTEAETMGADAP